MLTDALQLEPLGPQDAALLTALFTASDAFTPWVEVGAFRHAQLKHRKDIDRLERVGYIRKERIRSEECYCVSLTALAQLREHPVIAEVLDVADAMWVEFRDHFEKARGEPHALSAVAEAIGKPTDLTELVYVYMLEWWRTPRCITPDEAEVQLVVASEEVFDHDSFDDCIFELKKEQLRRLQSAPSGFINSPWQCDAPAPMAAPVAPAFLEPSWFSKLPPHAQAIMREMHVARSSGLMALTAMGIRAVIDVVADDLLKSAEWGFGEKLTALHEDEHLTADQLQTIKAVVEVGHAAAHRAHVPSDRDVQLMQEALDHVLCSAYGLQNAQQELASRTPVGSKPTKRRKVS